MSGRLAGKTAFITGSSSGLGRAIALRYASEGAKVCCADLEAQPRVAGATHQEDSRDAATTSTHEAIIEAHGQGKATFTKIDVTSAVSVELAVQHCVKVFGRLDIVVPSAGITFEMFRPTPLKCHETPESDFVKTLAVNTTGVFLTCKYALGQMMKQEPLPGQDRGWVVNLASIFGLTASVGGAAYCASKGAVVLLTKQMALDYAADKIHVNCLCPGFMKTAFTQQLQDQPDVTAWYGQRHPFAGGGMGEPDAVAKAAVFLASEDAAWVTGVPLPVDGGYMVW